jgi:putative endonuclease
VDSGEDRGSTPLASSLRSQRSEERRLSRRSLSAEADGLTTDQIVASYGSASQQRQMSSFTYVYILQSESNPSHFYTGRTADLRERLDRHNSGKVPHTTKWKQWRIKTYIAFSNTTRAADFEHYLKSASGRAFLKKRL